MIKLFDNKQYSPGPISTIAARTHNAILIFCFIVVTANEFNLQIGWELDCDGWTSHFTNNRSRRVDVQTPSRAWIVFECIRLIALEVIFNQIHRLNWRFLKRTARFDLKQTSEHTGVAPLLTIRFIRLLLSQQWLERESERHWAISIEVCLTSDSSAASSLSWVNRKPLVETLVRILKQLTFRSMFLILIQIIYLTC